MTVQDLQSLTSALPTLKITPETTPPEAAAAPRILGSFNQCSLGLVRFSGQPPWELHPDDELLHVLDGEVQLTLLTDSGPDRIRLRPNSLYVVPWGIWHRSLARAPVTLIFGTSSEGNKHSFAEDPRTDPNPVAFGS